VKPERKKGSSFASLARIDHVRFVSVRGEGAVETVSAVSYEKKKIYICRYTSSEDERKRKNPLGPVPSSVFAVARACSPFETESAESVVKARYDRA